MKPVRRREGRTVLCVLSSEFADIEVAIDHRGNGERLALRDLRGDHAACFDPLELETLVWCERHVLTEQMDPGAMRWREAD